MELVDLYDENRVPLGRTAERHAPKGPGEYKVVVHVCAFDSRGRLLIQRRAAEREFREELGYPLDLGDLRPSVTVNFDGGFDDFFIIQKDFDLSALVLQKEEVAEVRYAAEEEVEAMRLEGSFIPYPEGFLPFLFAMRNTFGFPSK